MQLQILRLHKCLDDMILLQSFVYKLHISDPKVVLTSPIFLFTPYYALHIEIWHFSKLKLLIKSSDPFAACVCL